MNKLHCKYQPSPNSDSCTYLCTMDNKYCKTPLYYHGDCVSTFKTIMYYDASININGTSLSPSKCPTLHYSDNQNTYGLGFMFFGIFILAGVILILLDYKSKCSNCLRNCFGSQPKIEKIIEFVVFRTPHNRITPEENTINDNMCRTEHNVESIREIESFNSANTQIII